MKPVFFISVSFLLMFALVEWLHRRRGLSVEHSRKIAHVLGGGIALVFPFFLEKWWQIVLLGLLFTALLAVSKQLGLLGSIHKVQRKTVGSIIFPLPIVICFVAFLEKGQPIFYLLPIAVLTFSDTLAFIFGRRFRWRPFQIWGCDKSLGGSLAFLISAFILSIAAFHFFPESETPLST